MCRNIKKLRHADQLPSDEDAAVRDVAAVARVLFRSLHVRGETAAV